MDLVGTLQGTIHSCLHTTNHSLLYLLLVQPNPEQQAALFTITADRFVHLILSNTSKVKDELFQVSELHQ